MNQARIIVVEREPIIAMDVEETLAGAGLDVIAVTPSLSCAFRMHAEQPVHLIILDLDSRNGDATIPWFGPPVVLITSQSLPRNVHQLRLAHRCGCATVAKPFVSHHLLDAVTCVLQQQPRADLRRNGKGAFNGQSAPTSIHTHRGGNHGISRDPTIPKSQRTRLVAS